MKTSVIIYMLKQYSFKYIHPNKKVYVLQRTYNVNLPDIAIPNKMFYTMPFYKLDGEVHNVLVSYVEKTHAIQYGKILNANVVQQNVRDVIEYGTLLKMPSVVIINISENSVKEVHYELFYKDGRLNTKFGRFTL